MTEIMSIEEFVDILRRETTNRKATWKILGNGTIRHITPGGRKMCPISFLRNLSHMYADRAGQLLGLSFYDRRIIIGASDLNYNYMVSVDPECNTKLYDEKVFKLRLDIVEALESARALED